MKVHRTLTKFVVWMAKLSDKQTHDTLLRMQKSIEYCQEENRIFRELLRNKGCKRLLLNDSQRRRLAYRGNEIGKQLLGQISILFSPETVLSWYRKLISQKYDSSKNRKKGRRRITKELIELVIKIAQSNPSWVMTK